MQITVRRIREGGIHGVLLLFALVSILTSLGIVIVLLTEAAPFFLQRTDSGDLTWLVTPWEFLTGKQWNPSHPPPRFGVLPLVTGTLMVAGGALVVAVPIGLATAIFLSEYAPGWVRQFAKPVLEVLAGIPTVVYGFFALTYITPEILKPLGAWIGVEVGTFNALSAAIVVGIMIIPTIVSLCDDALRAVPRALREGAFALAATRFEVAIRVVLPAAMSGCVAAVLLALARAIGETMAVSMAAGMQPQVTRLPSGEVNLGFNYLEQIQTMTGYMVQVLTGDTAAGAIEYKAVFAVALTLFAMTLAVNLLSYRIMRRFREEYE